jgi:hypothetical protein
MLVWVCISPYDGRPRALAQALSSVQHLAAERRLQVSQPAAAWFRKLGVRMQQQGQQQGLLQCCSVSCGGTAAVKSCSNGRCRTGALPRKQWQAL